MFTASAPRVGGNAAAFYTNGVTEGTAQSNRDGVLSSRSTEGALKTRKLLIRSPRARLRLRWSRLALKTPLPAVFSPPPPLIVASEKVTGALGPFSHPLWSSQENHVCFPTVTHRLNLYPAFLVFWVFFKAAHSRRLALRHLGRRPVRYYPPECADRLLKWGVVPGDTPTLLCCSFRAKLHYHIAHLFKHSWALCVNAEASQAGFMSAGAPEIFHEWLFSDGDVIF